MSLSFTKSLGGEPPVPHLPPTKPERLGPNLTEAMMVTSTSSGEARRQKGCTLTELKEMSSYNVLVSEISETDKSVLKKPKTKVRNVARSSVYSTKTVEKKESLDVSIFSAPDSGGADLRETLENIHPKRAPESQEKWLRSLEALSYDAVSHSSIIAPSVVQNLYFFIRAPSTSPTPLEWNLITFSCSVLANTMVSYPELADDLVLLKMDQEILKILRLFLPLPVRPPDGVCLAVEKIVGLFTNLQAKTKSHPLPYTLETEDEIIDPANPKKEEKGNTGEDLMNILLGLSTISSLPARRSVLLCLKNLMLESRLFRRFLGLKDWHNPLCAIYSTTITSLVEFLPDSADVLADCLQTLSFFSYFTDEFASHFLTHYVGSHILYVLQGDASSVHGVYHEGCRVLSFLTSVEGICNTELIPTTGITETMVEFLLGGNPGPGPIGFDDVTIKFVLNTICNLSIPGGTHVDQVVGTLLADKRVIPRLLDTLQEGDRVPSVVQIKIATLLMNIMSSKEGRPRIASIRKVKDIFRSQVSSTNRVLRDIMGKLLAELRDEAKKGPLDDAENQQKIAKMKERRAHVIDELMSTEETYLDHLLQMVAMFLRYKVITSQENRKTHEENATEMHANVEQLSSVHFKLLQELQKLKKRDEAGGSGPPVSPFPPKEGEGESPTTLGGILKEFLVGKLDIYRTYTRNFEKYQRITDEKSFKKFLEAEKKTAMKTNIKRVELSTQSLLITPIQRIPRCVLLLEDLLDHMSSDDPDYKLLNDSFEGMMDMMEYLEFEKNRLEATAKVSEIGSRISNLTINLDRESERVFIRGSSCFVDDSIHEELRKSQVFLFSDLFLFTVPNEREKNKYKFKRLLPLYVIETAVADPVVLDESETTLQGFIVRHRLEPELTWTVYVGSQNERDSWLSALHEAKVSFCFVLFFDCSFMVFAYFV